jgi:PAS domain S-box-containing protein
MNASMAVENLAGAVRSTSRTVVLFELDSLRVVAMSDSAAVLLGIEPTSAQPASIRQFTKTDDAGFRALELLRSGGMTAYTALWSAPNSDERRPEKVWVRAVDIVGPHSHAVATPIGPPADAGESLRAIADIAAAVGIRDRLGQIRQVSTDITPILGYTQSELVGVKPEDLAHPSDAKAVRNAFEQAKSLDTDVDVVVRLRNKAGEWQAISLTVSPPDRELQSFRFAALPAIPIAFDGEATRSDRVAELERHLVRIAREVEAAGLLRPAGPIDEDRFPELKELTSRQFQILSMLLRGERVSAIADAMYLSASTVRNHLSAIYRKAGVHSQAELIAKLHALPPTSTNSAT